MEKKWVTPNLIVLIRDTSEASVLLGCKANYCFRCPVTDISTCRRQNIYYSGCGALDCKAIIDS